MLVILNKQKVKQLLLYNSWYVIKSISFPTLEGVQGKKKELITCLKSLNISILHVCFFKFLYNEFI